jgi:hypothetical protein
VPLSKTASYLLSPDHDDGGAKAKFFLGYGFTQTNPSQLSRALLQHAADNEVAEVVDSQYGVKYIVEGDMLMANGKVKGVRSVWIVDTGTTAPRLVTAYPLED